MPNVTETTGAGVVTRHDGLRDNGYRLVVSRDSETGGHDRVGKRWTSTSKVAKTPELGGLLRCHSDPVSLPVRVRRCRRSLQTTSKLVSGACSRVAQHYEITITPDDGKKAVARTLNAIEGTMMSHPGV